MVYNRKGLLDLDPDPDPSHSRRQLTARSTFVRLFVPSYNLTHLTPSRTPTAATRFTLFASRVVVVLTLVAVFNLFVGAKPNCTLADRHTETSIVWGIRHQPIVNRGVPMLYIFLQDVLTGASRALTSLLSLENSATMQYDNSTLTITSVGTPDPFVTLFRGRYYLTFTAGNRVEIWSSSSLADIESSAARHVIWTPPQGTDHSADLWAPELHAVHGRWYVYYAAANPAHGNKSHRMYVLGGPLASEDPCRGQWEFLGRIVGMSDHWAIDGTVFELNGDIYFAYSGWPLEDAEDPSDLIQQLFILKLADPTSAASAAVVISAPQHPWEITREGNGTDHGINEGPQFLSSPDGGIAWRGLVYSCAGSWTHEYKMGLLQYIGGDPLDPESWRKGEEPLVQTRKHGTGPFGPGHGSFVTLGGEVVAIYHATDSPMDGWDNRRARAQRVLFTEEGPYMGRSFGMDTSRPEGGLVRRLKYKLARSTRSKYEMAGEKGLRILLGSRTAYN